MKKTLLLFAMLLGVVGAWAQRTMPTISDEPQNGEWAENTTWYTLKTKNGYYYKTDLSLNTSSKPTAADIAGNHKYQWCITGNETVGYKLYNRYQGAGQFLGSNNINGGTSNCYFTSEVQDKITTFKFRESTHGDAWWCLQLNGNTAEAYLARNGSGAHLIAWCTGYNTAKGDGGAPITFEEVEDLPEISLTNVQPNDDQLTLYIDATTQTLTFSMDSPKELGAKAKFAYVLHDGKYTFYNEASKSFLIWRGNTSGGFNGNKGTLSNYNATYCDWSLIQSEQNGVTYFRMNSKRSDSSDGTLILLTSVGKQEYRFDGYGNTVGWTPEKDGKQYSNLFTILINCSLYNEASGSTFQLTHSTPDIGVKPTITIRGIVGATLSDEVFNDGCEYSANITFPFPVSKKNGVTNPTMISSFKGDSHQADGSFLWYADNGIVKIKKHVEANSGRKVASEKNIISYLWALYPECENGVFSVGIWNIGAGNYISFEKEYDTNEGSANEAEDLKLENEKVTQFNVAANNAFYHTINGKEHRLSFGSVTYDSGNLGVYVKNHGGTYNSFHTPAITTQISDAKYSTICLPFAANLPEGVEAYSIETVNAASATLTPKEGLPANTGAILKAEPGYYTFTQTEEEIDTWDGNLLYGSVEDIYWYGDGYVLSKKEGVVALYKAELNYILSEGVPEKVTVGGKYFKNNAGKALLPTTSLIADARFLVFSFGDDMETGITETENGNVKTENTEVYDLSGRRVQGAQKGIFIVNGKKVVR